jgi:hypothetical protein
MVESPLLDLDFLVRRDAGRGTIIQANKASLMMGRAGFQSSLCEFDPKKKRFRPQNRQAEALP